MIQASWGERPEERDDPEFRERAAAHREVFGRVYELITGDSQDGPHPYAGQTTQTIHQRVHGRGGHTSPESIAADPWKARIRPGRAGYRCLKTIYATGNPGADQVRLDMAEAFAIDELRTTYNKQRPIRQPGRPAPRPAQGRIGRRRPRRLPGRLLGFLTLAGFFTYLAARVVAGMDLPWPAAPWVVSPMAGVLLGWLTFWKIHRSVRKILR